MTRIVAGIDLGSTGVKILLADADDECRTLLVRQLPTPWRAAPQGRTELDADTLLATLTDLLTGAAADLAQDPALVGRPVLAVAISGMGETGILLDRDDRPAAPGIAWFDPRGEDRSTELAERFGEEFPARTGLPLGVQLPVVKLATLAAEGLDLADLRWTNLPDWVAFALGARLAVDSSLTSRTGMLDADTGAAWAAMATHLGVGPDFLPPVLDAGTDRGEATAEWLPAPFRGARVTVAGHDHLVSAVAGGAVADDRYHASLGTAEVLLRVLDEPLPPAARVRLAAFLINCVRHVVPGTHVLVAGVKTGLLQRRALQLAGISDRAGRDALDAAVMDLPVDGALEPGAVEVTGARNDDGVLAVRLPADGVGPAELFAAVLRHGNDELARLVEAMDAELPPARATVLTGGWAQMRSVQRARARVLPAPEVSGREEDTAHGAALFAARLLPA
ncbi:FGGY family carbohydrate kinase [Kineococcus gynurae]|uniref:FGGY family carbohydrate kinase n=1 Tax=Kineococcus gynurae TaxID=452979 RepID=A0ABV5LMM3_9ACTN